MCVCVLVVVCLCKCVYVCLCVCVCVCVCLYAHTYIYIYTYIDNSRFQEHRQILVIVFVGMRDVHLLGWDVSFPQFLRWHSLWSAFQYKILLTSQVE